ncbi:glycosyltransferase family 1 protein [Nesterenkonia rhizosphaerae]|uniref:glycosyltransferase family 4 protein n=1 Tax=Nesterenkonia rhizosphaerae TaxID=1348272 RepID=UPI0031E89AAC
MRLFVDCRYVRTRVHDGISRYTASLVQAAAEKADVTMLIHDEQQLGMLPDLPAVKISSPTSALEPFVAQQINPHQPDVVFSPMQTMGSVGRRYRLILTLHDLIYYEHRTPPRDLPAPVRLGWRLYHLSYTPQRMALNRADAVATISETTRGLMEKHRLTRRPLHLIPNAAQPVEQPRDPAVPPARELVYMGSFMEYKNVEAVIAGLNRLPEYRLHLCSPISPARRAQLVALAERPGQLIFHNGISEQDYTALLQQVTALVTLSRAEGYGLPVVEAMSHGTPVVVSDLPIFREVTGVANKVSQDDLAAGAQCVDADDDAAFAAAVRRLEDPAAFQAASVQARTRSQAYSWEDSADRLVTLARSLIER